MEHPARREVLDRLELRVHPDSPDLGELQAPMEVREMQEPKVNPDCRANVATKVKQALRAKAACPVHVDFRVPLVQKESVANAV